MSHQNQNDISNEHPNIQLIRRLFDGMFELSHIELYDQLFAKTIHFHGPMSGFENTIALSQAKKIDTRFAKAFKKNHLDIQEIFANQDKVVVCWTIHAIHQKNEKKIVVSGTSIYRITNGKINEIWQSWDRLGMLEQLGEVRVRSNLIDLESNYDTLKKFGLEKYAEQALTLSDREKQCLILLLQGKTAKETANVLKLSFRTIESYLENIKIKLFCTTKRDLLKMAQILEKLDLL